jgi:Flp pilus assembly protein protease CpaA
MIEVFLIILALIWLIFAVVSDLKTKEIPNWLNFSLIIFALGIRFFYSLFDNDWNILLQGVFGFAVFFILANILYSCRFFAGGDAKLMYALGPVLPFGTDFLSNANLFLEFLFIFLFAGAVYGMVVLLKLSTQNFLKIKKGFFKKIKSNKTTVIIFFILGIILMILGYFYASLFVLGVLIFLTPYLVIYATIVDETCMVERVKTSQLTEGDWLHNDVKVGKNTIKYKWEGLSMREIAILRKKYKYVLIKIGIEFSPVFLISFLIYAYLYLMGINLWNSLW